MAYSTVLKYGAPLDGMLHCLLANSAPAVCEGGGGGGGGGVISPSFRHMWKLR